MANEISYFDTPYTFINPVRYFKANDPYYYEVDNIPIKQLEETSNFLKDQVDGLLNFKDNLNIEIDRKGFSELRPYSTGNDRKVRVKPGRYTARINNAFDITPLQVVAQIGGYANNEPGWGQEPYNKWEFETIHGATVKASLDEFQNGLIGSAYMMNGLYERAFVYPVSDGDGADVNWNPWKYLGNAGNTPPTPITSPGYNPPAYGYGSMPGGSPHDFWRWAAYPNYTGVQPQYNIPESVTSGPDQGTMVKALAKNQGLIESEFIKRWRGAIRTSVVDVPEELVITIPDYSDDDFFYFDTNGDRQPIPSQQRIDLLFIYSKAIDETTTTINKFDANGNPTQLTRATLGIVKGAGVGISREIGPNMATPKQLVDIQDADGTPLMFAHPGDHGPNAPDNVGFSSTAGTIKGSFPSPDDLMNLAPVLSENLETNTFPLIGQSILPIAYIRVQAPTGGGPIIDLITEEDIIDIRPFFRTTELAYNERAGIAAATPQISIANPVVTEVHLEEMRQEILTPLDERITVLENVTTGLQGAASPTSNECRIIATGQVLGGFWGPEGALIGHAREAIGGDILETPMNSMVDLIEEDFGYKSGSIPYWPDWDKASWYDKGSFNEDKICDHINVGAPWLVEQGGDGGNVKYMPPWITSETPERTVQSIRNQYGYDRAHMYEWKSNDGGPTTWNEAQDSLNARFIQLNYVSKRIKLNFDNTPWVQDYHVKVNLLHCLPLGETQHEGVNTIGTPLDRPRQTSQIWIQKFKDYFVVNVSWAGHILHPGTAVHAPWQDRNNPEKFAGFAQPQMSMFSTSNWKTGGGSPAGYSINMSPEPRIEHFNDMINAGLSESDSGWSEPSFINAVTPLVYPSVQWEVVGIGGDFLTRSLGAGGRNMQLRNPTVTTV